MSTRQKTFEDTRHLQQYPERESDGSAHEADRPPQVMPSNITSLPAATTHTIQLQRLCAPNAKQAGGQMQRAYGNCYLGKASQGQGSLLVQPKLTVAPQNDQYEKEAERVAGEVMQSVHDGSSQPSSKSQSARLARRAAAQVMRKVVNSGGLQTGMTVPPAVETNIRRARGGGQQLPHETRVSMEHALGADFGDVRIHTGAAAESLNQDLRSRAFTTGQDIFFRRGTYSPSTAAGKRLLAHELAHVVQQQQITDLNGASRSTVTTGSIPAVFGPHLVQRAVYPDPNGQYEAEDFKFEKEVEKRERPKKVNVIKKKVRGDKPKPPDAKSYLKKTSRKMDEKDKADFSGYHRGHIIGHTLGGPSESYNIVPMLHGFNTSEYKLVENEATKISRCNIEVNLSYPTEGDAADPRVPTAYNIIITHDSSDNEVEEANPLASDEISGERMDFEPSSSKGKGKSNKRSHDEGMSNGPSESLAEEPAYKKKKVLRKYYLPHMTLGTEQKPGLRKAIDEVTSNIEKAANSKSLTQCLGRKLDTKGTAAFVADLKKTSHLPPLARYYPKDKIYRPYEELDILYFSNSLEEINIQNGFEAGADFTEKQKELILQANLARNDGKLKSDDLTDPYKTLDPNDRLGQPEVDHIIPKGSGGSNFFSNARVISWHHNNKNQRIKSVSEFVNPEDRAELINADYEEAITEVLIREESPIPKDDLLPKARKLTGKNYKTTKEKIINYLNSLLTEKRVIYDNNKDTWQWVPTQPYRMNDFAGKNPIKKKDKSPPSNKSKRKVNKPKGK